MTHPFLFSKAVWLGQGILRYTHTSEDLAFNTRWEISEISPGIFQAKHKVEITDADEPHSNTYTIFPIDASSFRIVIQNPIIDLAEGTGFIEENRIGWRIDTEELKGHEVFTKIDEKTYTLEGEYYSQEIRSKIQGKIWKKFQP